MQFARLACHSRKAHDAASKIHPQGVTALAVAELRQTLGSFATGVAVATTLDAKGIPKGFAANSFTSVSLDPPLVLVCVDETASCHPAFAGTGHFAINILCEAPQHVSRAFASKSPDKFAHMPWVPGVTQYFPIQPRGSIARFITVSKPAII